MPPKKEKIQPISSFILQNCPQCNRPMYSYSKKQIALQQYNITNKIIDACPDCGQKKKNGNYKEAQEYNKKFSKTENNYMQDIFKQQQNEFDYQKRKNFFTQKGGQWKKSMEDIDRKRKEKGQEYQDKRISKLQEKYHHEVYLPKQKKEEKNSEYFF